MDSNYFFCLVFLILFSFCHVEGAKKKSGLDLVEKVEDVKEMKKMLKTRNNVLVVFAKSGKDLKKVMSVLGQAAEAVRGMGTMATVDCSTNDGKKTCKKFKAKPRDVILKHYHNGDFHKDYDRTVAAKSMASFMKDPTGDIPWDEDGAARDVRHLESPEDLVRLLSKDPSPTLIMFYAPWCGHCKRMKPDYALAATEMKGKAVVAGMDVDKAENAAVRIKFNITGFPTLLYFENGQEKFKYAGGHSKEDLIKFLNDPKEPEAPKPEVSWAEETDDVHFPTEEGFDAFLVDNPSTLVMFYAPWCGHCKAMKPEYVEAAKIIHEGKHGALAAVDATQYPSLGTKYKVTGYPTVKYFKDGELQFDVNERKKDGMVDFMKDPKEPPPPPEPEQDWSETKSEVVHLTDGNFNTFLKKRKHALVMFYAPWCGHCKRAKPEFTEAAEAFKDTLKVAYAAIDCTAHRSSCDENKVQGYPTLKYFNYGQLGMPYQGGREKKEFIQYMSEKSGIRAAGQEEEEAKPAAGQDWAEVEGNELLTHLTNENFDAFMEQNSPVVIMFYAPWCGHCKNMKPEYGNAAKLIAQDSQFTGKFATVDASVESGIAGRFGVKGYPTIKRFVNGEEGDEFAASRTADLLAKFIKDPKSTKEPEKPAEVDWAAEMPAVQFLTAETFPSLAGVEYSLVMFFAPWCGHCKRAKPAFNAAAASFGENPSRVFVAVDCTKNKELCGENEVRGYPTFLHFQFGQKVEKYGGGRTEQDFVQYMVAPPAPQQQEDQVVEAERIAKEEAEKKQREEQQRVEAERKRQEEEEKLEAERKRKEERDRLEAERMRQEEQERLEAERKRQEEQERLEAERKRQEEQERQEAEKQRRDEEERLAAERRRQEQEEQMRREEEERLRVEQENRMREEEEARRLAEQQAREAAQQQAEQAAQEPVQQQEAGSDEQRVEL